MTEERRCLSYLLRLWQTELEGAFVWRASLQDAHTGKRQSFTGLVELYAFLEQETTAKASPYGPSCHPTGD